MTRAGHVTRICLTILAAILAACADPAEPPPAASAAPSFVGSVACRECHADQFAAWRGSHHELAMQAAGPRTVLGDFADASFDDHGETTRFIERNGDYLVVTADADGKQREYRVDYTFGIEPLQQYLVEFPGGRLQALPFSWDTRPASDGGQRWFHVYGDEYISRDDPLHWTGREQNWNYQCAECHSTNVVMGYDVASDSFETTYSEISVGCEACHGPASRHVADPEGGAGGLVIDLDDRGGASWIMNPDTGIAERSTARASAQGQPEACGRCHARRGTITEDYEYGRALADTHRPALIEEPLYFPDGQIRDEVYVYGSFLQSRMYRAGVTCTDCHDPHAAGLRTPGDPNAVCATCHLPSRFASVSHAGHEPSQAGCVDCHMPERTYMVVDDRRDHSFRVPRPDLSVISDVPNACGACHDDRDAAWATQAIARMRPAGIRLSAPFAVAFIRAPLRHNNPALRGVASIDDSGAIVQASAIERLRLPFSTEDVELLQWAFDHPDPLVRMAALRRLRLLPADAKVESGASRLLSDPVLSVRLDAALAFAGLADLLPASAARAWGVAAREYRESLAIIANRPESYSALGAFEAELGDFDAAIAAYRQALHLEPAATVARANLADVFRAIGDDDSAGALLDDGLDLDPDNAALLHAQGLLYVRTGRRDDAVELLRRAADVDAANPRYVYVYAVALHSTGDGTEAIDVLRDAHDRFPGDFEIAWALATMLEESGDTDAALGIATELAAQFPENQAVVTLHQRLRAR